jgi:hypothetical protein
VQPGNVFQTPSFVQDRGFHAIHLESILKISFGRNLQTKPI